MFLPVTITQNDPIQVGSIYTANASFRKRILEEVGGWEEDLDFCEDSEMCEKLFKKFKNKKILFTKEAFVIHKHQTSFFYFLRQTYNRGESTLKYYLKYNKIPPIFPFPLSILVLTFLMGYFDILLGFFTLIISPHFFYLWWPIKILREFKFYYLLFPYMQFSLELAKILGMLRGFIILKLMGKI